MTLKFGSHRNSLTAHIQTMSSSDDSAKPPPAQSAEEDANAGESSSSAAAPAKRWDDPPDKEPPGPAENETTMILVAQRRLKSGERWLGSDIQSVAFSSSGAFITATNRARYEPGYFPRSNAVVWDAQTGTKLDLSSCGLGFVRGDVALEPGAGAGIACPTHRWYTSKSGAEPPPPRLEVFDLALKRRRLRWDLPIRGPLAWSPDGLLLAALSDHEQSRIYVFALATQLLVRAIPHHIGEVTHLAFMPDGDSLVSLSKDGSCKVTSLGTGRVLGKFEVESRHDPVALQVSPDGGTIASVWGRDVMIWEHRENRMLSYHLGDVRATDESVLAISPDCRLLACRAEQGFEVLDLRTGKFRGEIALGTGSFTTAAAFSSDGKLLVLGKHNGEVIVYQVVSTD